MELKNSKIFKKEIIQAVSAYCESEKIEDIDHFMYLCFKQGFDIKRYGLLGDNSEKIGGEQKKWVEKEVIVEKRVEVPVEVIKEVEKIVEVPVEVIKEVVKEVPIEKVITKIEYISDKTGENELTEKIFHLNEELEKEKQKFSTKTKEMENNFQNEMSKKNEELDELRRNLDIILDKPPVEIVKEVEKIVEVIKEVEKPNDNMSMLQETLLSLRKELHTKNERIKELEKINRDLENISSQKGAVFLRGSNLNNRI
jgi:hypothetical protein